MAMVMLSKLKYHSLSRQDPIILFMIVMAYPYISDWGVNTLQVISLGSNLNYNPYLGIVLQLIEYIWYTWYTDIFICVCYNKPRFASYPDIYHEVYPPPLTHTHSFALTCTQV